MKIQILLLSFIFSFFVSCVKEDDTKKVEAKDTIKEEVKPPVEVKNSHRITKVSNVNHLGVITGQTRYTYEGENLLRVSYYSYSNGEPWEKTRSEYTYSLNEITRIDTRSGDDFQQAETKYVYKFIDGKGTEAIKYMYFGGFFDEREKVNYTYLNGKLVSSSVYIQMTEYERVNYNYENDRLKGYTVLANNSNVWEDMRKTDCFYENGKLVKRIQTDLESGSWNIKLTREYFYSGNEITTVTLKQWNVVEPSVYKYENNYLVEVVYGRDKMIYEYEAGHGNASVVLGGPTASLFAGQTIR